jgi:hypothetical protein
MQLLLAALITLTAAPLPAASDDVLQPIFDAFLQLGRDHPDLAVSTKEVTFSTYRTRTAMIKAGREICNDRIERFAGRTVVSIVIDAGTIKGSSFLGNYVVRARHGIASDTHASRNQS